ncbi:MAG: carboxylating nicotinate-nucleotide diphosphorylase [Methanobacteriaceae archaeon]|jgi:nicotinate-nucleotide pyrophosphorylase (carboxylating)|nr:carboxylating nicotinate-nucleotide diphosphorylase [Methanobacteriaceae archaeon]OPY23931.1 MAG: nicotinate-nucleotide pyrophosphorylase [Methanobacterium sp. PtaU1.Bin097]
MRKDLKDLTQMLNQDIGFEDITTRALIDADLQIKARIISKQEGVIAGAELLSSLLEEFGISTGNIKEDGTHVKLDETILDMEGEARTILTMERTILNLLMRMSGIATATSQMVQKARERNPDIRVAATRKTTPGLQFWEKEAVRVGGGDTHRYRLDDAVLIKDNHLALVGDVELAIRKARQYASFTKKIEVEVENLQDAISAAEAGADIIMLDNMPVDEIERVLGALIEKGLRDKVLIEISGGINPDNIAEYAGTGADIVSSGYLTHSAGVLDLSLEIR